jgi:signal transduction histidine kinase
MFIFGIIWIMQVIFINTFYKQMMIDEVKKIGNSLYNTDLNESNLDEIAYKNFLNIAVINFNKDVVYITDGIKQVNGRTQLLDLDMAINKINSVSDKNLTYVMNIKNFNLERIIYVSKSNNYYMVISCNIEPVALITKVLSNQLIYITVISIALSFVISFVISKRIVSPINSLTRSAKELGKGNYNVTFEQTEYEEINSLANALNYSVDELSKTDNLRKELIANVSHDLRTPLTIIKSYAEMIKDISGETKEAREKHLDVIINQSELLTKLTEDMMDLSKLETNVEQLNISKFDIINSISNILEGFRYLKEYNFILEIDKGLEAKIVSADKIKIEQVLYNLIANAVNYVGNDKNVYVIVKEEGNKLIIQVKDNGKGIDEENIKYIFNRYYKSNDKQRKSGFGTGLRTFYS